MRTHLRRCPDGHDKRLVDRTFDSDNIEARYEAVARQRAAKGA
jgi:hypothetical protein